MADTEHVNIPNYLDRQFAVTEPNQIWVGDVTYIRTSQGWYYLAVVMDLFASKPIGWAMSNSPDSNLTCKALTMAFEARGRPTGLLFYSDQRHTLYKQAISSVALEISNQPESIKARKQLG